ncbi:S1 family peptidase [Rhodococcus sp. ABRD24]|uniref:S1 family peptidase n=1 Tax=Rhodococcus sp. ABRD24 TaxID=2507582 RepID=UPI001A954BA1|nr:S1 family peptidase [Rhodococcus sp. ABRD24]
MHKSLARCAAAVVVAVAVAALSVAGTAQAAPSGPSLSAADGLPADLVAALQRDLQLTPQQYLDRAAAAQQVAGYARDVRRADPGSFGGAWLDADGTPTVAVTTQAAADRVVAAGYRPEIVPFSADGLERALAQPNQRMGTPPPMPRFRVASGTSPIGGDAYISTPVPIADAGSYLVCSFGFTAADSAGTPLALSAGHCDPSRATTGTANAAQVYVPDFADLRSSQLVGSFAESGIGETGGGLDYAVIRLTPDAATTGLGQPTVRSVGGSTLTITGTAVPVVGAPVCKSGQTSGYTCGTVLESDFTTNLEGDAGEIWSVRGFTDSACTLAGDSGGAIITGTLALGITSGSNVADAPDCARAATVSGGTMTFGIAVRDVLARVNGSMECPAVPGIGLRTGANPAGSCATEPEPEPEPESPAGGFGSGSLGSLGSAS